MSWCLPVFELLYSDLMYLFLINFTSGISKIILTFGTENYTTIHVDLC